MADLNGSPGASHRRTASEDSTILGTGVTTRHIEAFSRKVTTTASHLIGDPAASTTYQNAMVELQKELRRPGIQQRVFSYAKASPTEMVRKNLSTSEIQHRALTYLSDELLARIPEDDNAYSLFQGFQATLPETEASEHRKKHRRNIKGQKLLEHSGNDEPETPLEQVKREKRKLSHRLEMLGVRKNMCSSEIREIDNKISNLNTMRKIVLDRLEGLEQDEVQIEQDLLQVDNKMEDLLEQMDDVVALGNSPPSEETEKDSENHEMTETDTFMSESIYQKLPSPKSKRKPIARRKSAPIRHEHFQPGSNIREMQAHNDMITALDFDAPFGTLVTSALDDTVRVWDLNLGRCIGLLEGHQASVRCLQVEENIVATGSMDASIRLWDLSQADYAPYENTPSHSTIQEENETDDGLAYEEPESQTSSQPQSQLSGMRDCALTTLSGHVAEITALNFHGDTLVSGSADKTLRQWDLTKGRCVQTLDVLWAAAQASATINTTSDSNSTSQNNGFRKTGSRIPDSSADFVGALQCFDAALACGTADGMVRLWDLRSGQVHRSLVGHTGAVTSLQFDERILVTGSADRSIRIWDLRTGSIVDAYAYNNPITSMMFDTRRIVAAAGETVAKIYDRTDGRHWDCGAGADAESTASDEKKSLPSFVERVRVKDGYLTEGRKDGFVGIWTC